jgi:hypothetical protein
MESRSRRFPPPWSVEAITSLNDHDHARRRARARWSVICRPNAASGTPGAIVHQPDLCRACSFHSAPSNRAGSHSKSIRNRSGRPVAGKHSRSPAAAACNTAPWRARVCQARLRQRSQRPRVFSLYALCRLVDRGIQSAFVLLSCSSNV